MEPCKELPIRSKLLILSKMSKIFEAMHQKNGDLSAHLVEDLKTHALFLEESIQQEVLSFGEQVLLQTQGTSSYCISKELHQATNCLIESMGFTPPKG